MPEGNGWSGYEKLVLARLEQLDERLVHLDNRITRMQDEEITRLKIEVAMLKVKSGLWGAAAGMLPVGLFVAFQIMAGN